MSFILEFDFFVSVLRMSIPLILAALGGFLSERCGVINIALEGKMLMGAFVAATAAHFLHSAAFGALAASVFGILLGLFYALITVTFKAHQVIAGTAFNLFALGITPFLANVLFGTTSSTPALSSETTFQYAPFFLVFIAAIVVVYIDKFTLLGLWHRVAGDMPQALEVSGISPIKVRYAALAFSGMLVCASGAMLSLFLSSGFARGMSAGRGFMALAAVVLGKWHPAGAVLGCLLFGFAEALQIQMQSGLNHSLANTLGFTVPVQLIEAMPYLFTLLILAGFVGKAKAPKYLGQN